ncbi:hypothetical protein GH714_003820 [Hevea brasiliensis]|uniref:Dymeclin n=1 Tax=Hevea brasiliensis TaxID=3981 RepID=A0A6A6KN74_HEVBR|nr:hypothetical protein GH714_003820 [Hevea brasiliensis]
MGAVPSTPRRGSARPQDTAEYLIGSFVGEKSFPLASDFWQKLLELPLNLRWPTDRVQEACQRFAQNNCYTRHLAKILIHLTQCLQESISTSGAPSPVYTKAINAVYISSVFLKYLIENAQSKNIEDLCLSLDESEPVPDGFIRDINIENLVMHSVLSFIGSVDVSANTYLLHQELLSFMLIAMSSQLLYGPSPGPTDMNLFIDAAMAQESSLVSLVVRRLLLNYIMRPRIPLNSTSYPVFSEGSQPGVLQRVGSAAVDRVDIEGNAHNGSLVRLPFASLFDTLGMCLGDETAALLLYTLVHGNSDFLEYVLVRTDLDTLLMPILETLYNTSKRTSNHIYILLIILLILSQDSSFNASIHKMILPSVPWYQEHLLHQTSLGSLMVIILIRTVKYNLSKLKDLYLHTTCLATLANMAPHVHRLSAYASQRLVSLFYMLSRKYNKLAERIDDKIGKSGSVEQGSFAEDLSAELHIYTDFLRIVLEILNAILTYALPRNPEVLDFFNSRVDAHAEDGEWSVEKVLQLVIINCRSWRGEGMKMFTQLHFSYEQESHPEEFFTPYIWRLALTHCGLSFNPSAINLFPVDLSVEKLNGYGGDADKHQNGELDQNEPLEV